MHRPITEKDALELGHAIDAHRRAMALFPDTEAAYQRFATVAEKGGPKGAFRAAYEALGEAIEAHPETRATWRTLCALQSRMGERPAA